MWTGQALLLALSSGSSWGGHGELPPCLPFLGAQGPSTSTALSNLAGAFESQPVISPSPW